MSCNYADGLSPYEYKGVLGVDEKFDSTEEVLKKVEQLTEWILESDHVVVHTGAGISTSAGIPDFRGPKGVWTLEEKGLKPELNVSFNDAKPTKTHMALKKLTDVGKVQYIISQNIDGLHLRSGLSRTRLSELHGNMFVLKCNQCERQFVMQRATATVGQRCLELPCYATRLNGRPCRGKLHDTILDWEHDLPEKELGMADFHSCVADLSICLGTTLQIVPSGNLPLSTKKRGGRLVICNLQPTKHDRKADLLINTYVDAVMEQLMKNLKLDIPEYTCDIDPTKIFIRSGDYIDWSIDSLTVKRMRKVYEAKCCQKSSKRKLIIKDIPKDKIKKEKLQFLEVKSEKEEHPISEIDTSIVVKSEVYR